MSGAFEHINSIFITTLEGDYSCPHFADEMKGSASSCPKLIIGQILFLNHDSVMYQYKVPSPKYGIHEQIPSTLSLCGPLLSQGTQLASSINFCFLFSASSSVSSFCPVLSSNLSFYRCETETQKKKFTSIGSHHRL